MLQHINFDGRGNKDENNLHLNSLEVNQKIQEHKKYSTAYDFYKPGYDKDKNIEMGLPRILSGKKDLNKSDQDIAEANVNMDEIHQNESGFQPKV